METVYFLGIDMSKKTLEGALTVDGKTFYQGNSDNTEMAIKAFFKEVMKKFAISHAQLIVCMEHTGIYCHPLLEFLIKNHIKVCLESSTQIKRSQGMVRGKNDKIDAQRIALYAYKNREDLTFWIPQRQVIQKLEAMLVTRDRLIRCKTELQVPIHECEEFIEKSIHNMIVKGCKSSIKMLEKDIEKIENMIQDLIKEDAQVKVKYQLATSVTGIGKITALNMIVSTGEFVRIQEAKKFACYSGVAPFEYSSGTSIRGKTRVSKLANMTIKKLLHLAAMSAIQYDDEIKLYYNRKVAEGKNKMSVINAVRNKLISRVFACRNNNRPYQKIYKHVLA